MVKDGRLFSVSRETRTLFGSWYGRTLPGYWRVLLVPVLFHVEQVGLLPPTAEDGRVDEVSNGLNDPVRAQEPASLDAPAWGTS